LRIGYKEPKRRLAVVGARRSAYTLFEIVLVMSVLVVIGALSAPLLKPLFSSNQLQAASDLIRSRWTEMRTRAVADGRAYRFSIIPGTGKFRIAPEDDSMESTQVGVRPYVVEESLPGSIHFLGGGSDSAASGGWSRLVTFLPSGTAHEDVQVTFGEPGSRSLALRLRGATGSVTAEEVDKK
jgi:hypothetical protein